MALFLALLPVVVVVSTPVLEQSAAIDTSSYYKLTNPLSGPKRPLDVYGDKKWLLYMGNDEFNYMAQKWQFVRVGDGPKYNIRNKYLGDSFSLDLCWEKGYTNITPCMYSRDDSELAQMRTVSSWPDGTYCISNDYFAGTQKHLGVNSTSPYTPIIGTGDQPCQHWSLTPFEKVEAPTPLPALTPDTGYPYDEGNTDYSLVLEPKGTIHVVMIFVYFDDMKIPLPTEAVQIANYLTGNGTALAQFYSDESKRKVSIKITAMTDLGWRPVSSKLKQPKLDDDVPQTNFIRAAVSEFPEINFQFFNVVMVVPQDGVKTGAAWVRSERSDITTISGKIRRAINFGWSDYKDRVGYYVAAHELGHCFGLPDLYQPSPKGDNESYVGAWDKMGEDRIAGHFLGWHKHKMGWLPAERAEFIARGWSGTRYITLSPYQDPYGVALLAIALSTNKVLVLEVAEPIPGTTGDAKVEGILTDSTVRSGQQPVNIIARNGDYDERYGNKYKAPWSVGNTTEFNSNGVRVKLTVDSKFWQSYFITIDVSSPKLIDQSKYGG